MGSMALIFALALLLAPDRATLPHPEIAKRVALGCARGQRRAGGAGGLRPAGGRGDGALAGSQDALQGGQFHRREDPQLSRWAAVAGFVERFSAGGGLIPADVEHDRRRLPLNTVRAFTGSSILVNMTFGRCVILMAASMASSVVPIPVVSWFAQVLALQQTMMRIFGVRPEPALACGAGLLFVTFLCIIPGGADLGATRACVAEGCIDRVRAPGRRGCRGSGGVTPGIAVMRNSRSRSLRLRRSCAMRRPAPLRMTSPGVDVCGMIARARPAPERGC